MVPGSGTTSGAARGLLALCVPEPHQGIQVGVARPPAEDGALALPALAKVPSDAEGLREVAPALLGDLAVVRRRRPPAARAPDRLGGEGRGGTALPAPLAMAPDPIAPVEGVEGDEGVALLRDEFDRGEDEIDLLLAREIGKRHAHPARLHSQHSPGDPGAVALRGNLIDPQETVAIRAGAGAAGPVLDSKQVVEESGDEVVVQSLDVEG